MTFLEVIVSTSPPPPRRSWSAAANHWASTMGPVVRDAMKAKAPVARTAPGDRRGAARAGAFRNSIDTQRTVSPKALRLEFVSHAPYAKFVVKGTAAHEIRPRNAPLLVWRDLKTGQLNRAKTVNHPGTRPNDFAKRALEAKMPEVRASFGEIMRVGMGGV